MIHTNDYKQLISVFQKINNSFTHLLDDKNFGTIVCGCGSNNCKFYKLPKCIWFYCNECGFYGNEYKLIENFLKKTPIIDPNTIKVSNLQDSINTFLEYSKNKYGSLFKSKHLLHKKYQEYIDVFFSNVSIDEEDLSNNIYICDKKEIEKYFIDVKLKQTEEEVIVIPHYFCEKYLTHLTIYLVNNHKNFYTNLNYNDLFVNTIIIDEYLLGLSNLDFKNIVILNSYPLLSEVVNSLFNKIGLGLSLHAIPKIQANVINLPYKLDEIENLAWMIKSWVDEEDSAAINLSYEYKHKLLFVKNLDKIFELKTLYDKSLFLEDYIKIFKTICDKETFESWWKVVAISEENKYLLEERFRFLKKSVNKLENKKYVFCPFINKNVFIDYKNGKIVDENGKSLCNFYVEVKEIHNYDERHSDLSIIIKGKEDKIVEIMLPLDVGEREKVEEIGKFCIKTFGESFYFFDPNIFTNFLLSINKPKIINHKDLYLQTLKSQFIIFKNNVVFKFDDVDFTEKIKLKNLQRSYIYKIFYPYYLTKNYKQTPTLVDFEFAKNIYSSLSNVEKIVLLKYLNLFLKQIFHSNKFFSAKVYNKNLIKDLFNGIGFDESVFKNLTKTKTIKVTIPIVYPFDVYSPHYLSSTFEKNVLHFKNLKNNNTDYDGEGDNNEEGRTGMLIEADKIFNVVVYYLSKFKRGEAKIRFKNLLKYFKDQISIYSLEI